MTLGMPVTRHRTAAPTFGAVLIALLLVPPAAHAATVSVEGGVLRVVAAPGEGNQLTVAAGADPALASYAVTDRGAPLTAGAGCTPAEDGSASCAVPAAAGIEIDTGDLDDSVSVAVPSIVRVAGGDGNDALSAASAGGTLDGGAGDDSIEGGDAADQLLGGDGDDSIEGGDAPDQLLGGAGDDSIEGGDAADQLDGGAGDDRVTGGGGDDALLGGAGADFADGGAGHDSVDLRDRISDSAWCGAGRDSVRGETLDALDVACERVDYGLPGRVGRLFPMTGGGRWVPIPGQTWALVDRRILADVLYLVRRYRVRVTEGYATTGHARFGEHPLGLAVDIEPGAGGTWADVSRLARWAEPRQNHPRFPFRWVGWNGDYNHGHPSRCKRSRGCAPHLHLSWAHSPGNPRDPVKTVWVWQVR